MDIRELYHELILDHGVNPRNFTSMEHPSHTASGHNPLCGDKITIYLEINNNKIIAATFDGNGCAISMASASLLTEELIGKNIKDARELFRNFQNMLTQELEPNTNLGKLDALANVRAFPTRVKCATLAWHTFLSAINNNNDVISTE